jgi:octaprenyl-diphosphate synthase
MASSFKGFSRIGHTLTAKEMWGLVKDDLEKVEKEIGLESVASVEAVSRIALYLHGNGGKRLRPILLLLANRLLAPPNENAIRLAAVVEMIHAATLVHDDVIDVASTRRGKPSTNIVFGNQISVLSGDWLYMQAFQIALRLRNFQVLDILTGLTQMMVEGELIQLDRIGRIDVSEADYMELIDRKTASLFAACSRLGALAASADEATETRLNEFGWSLGIAFQMMDDILDFTAREKTLGKPVGNDLREGKVTLPLIYALAEATPAERAQVETILADCSYDRVPLPAVLAMIEKYGGFQRARERAAAYVVRARVLIREFPDSPAQRALTAVTDMVVDRDR